MEKLCVVCGENDIEKFYRKRKTKCKKCILDDYHNHPNKKQYIQKQVTNSKKWQYNNLLRYRVLSAKHRAIRKGIEFEINDEIILRKLEEQEYKCFISKVTLELDSKGWYSISIDRLDSNKGYTIENTILVTKFVNTSKSNLNVDEYRKLLEEVCNAF